MKPARHLKGPDGECSPNCFPCKIKSVSFAASAMPTRSPEAARAKIGDPLLHKDRDAYRNLRRDGLQPKHVVGSAHLQANANEAHEVTTGIIESDPLIRRRQERAYREMPKPSADPIVREDAS